VVERQNQSVVGTVRAMLKTANLPGEFWGETMVTAVYILNRALTRSLERTPYMVWHGEKPFKYITCLLLDVLHM
jgi:hypothetical protein